MKCSKCCLNPYPEKCLSPGRVLLRNEKDALCPAMRAVMRLAKVLSNRDRADGTASSIPKKKRFKTATSGDWARWATGGK